MYAILSTQNEQGCRVRHPAHNLETLRSMATTKRSNVNFSIKCNFMILTSVWIVVASILSSFASTNNISASNSEQNTSAQTPNASSSQESKQVSCDNQPETNSKSSASAPPKPAVILERFFIRKIKVLNSTVFNWQITSKNCTQSHRNYSTTI
jgi:hypothetical protein